MHVGAAAALSACVICTAVRSDGIQPGAGLCMPAWGEVGETDGLASQHSELPCSPVGVHRACMFTALAMVDCWLRGAHAPPCPCPAA